MSPRLFFGFALVLLSLSTWAAERQDASLIGKAVSDFLRTETRGLPGQADFQVSAVDERLFLPRCPQLQAFTPPGARLWGSTSIGVRCAGEAAWTIYLPVRIRVTGNYLAAARPLAQGQILSAQDVTLRTGDLTQMPQGVLVEPAQAVGKLMVIGIASGQALRMDNLRAPQILQSNQPVKLVARGRGFVASAEGRALASAADGQTVQVRTGSGQVVAGIVRPGPQVEVF